MYAHFVVKILSKENRLEFGNAIDVIKLWLVGLGHQLQIWLLLLNKLYLDFRNKKKNKLNELNFDIFLEIKKINKKKNFFTKYFFKIITLKDLA